MEKRYELCVLVDPLFYDATSALDVQATADNAAHGPLPFRLPPALQSASQFSGGTNARPARVMRANRGVGGLR